MNCRGFLDTDFKESFLWQSSAFTSAVPCMDGFMYCLHSSVAMPPAIHLPSFPGVKVTVAVGAYSSKQDISLCSHYSEVLFTQRMLVEYLLRLWCCSSI